MIKLTVIGIALPFLMGFIIYLLPQLSRWLALFVGLFSAVYATTIFFQTAPLEIQLLDNFGVNLLVDELSGFFILTNAVVTIAVIAYCWQSEKTPFFFMQAIILHGSVNATFVCNDLISLYVALEVISVAAFLLISYPRTDKSIWVGLRYLFVSNTAMLFYLIGAILVYQAHHSFNYAGLRGSPPEAIALIFLGLLAKGGIFVSGLWLPLTHSESESPVSAMLSGVVVKAGVFPLVRCALLLEEINPIIKLFGVATAFLGVSYAIFEKDTKRTLAFSTISQLGFILAAPSVGGFYALTHGFAKSALFLTAGILPSRDFKQLRSQSIDSKAWFCLLIPSLSISGFPLLAGFSAKTIAIDNSFPWQATLLNIAAVGTAIVYAKFIFLPNRNSQKIARKSSGLISFFNLRFLAIYGLIIGLILANGFSLEPYIFKKLAKSLAIVGLGWLSYFLFINKVSLQLPNNNEKFDRLIGNMNLMLIVIFGLIVFWKGFYV